MFMTCTNCGNTIPDNAKFCGSCGFAVNNGGDAEKPKAKKIKDWWLVLGGLVIAAIIIAIKVIPWPADNNEDGNYALYIKDNGLYYTDLNGTDDWCITENLYSDNEECTEDIIKGDIGDRCAMSKDGEYFFFPEDVTIDEIVQGSHASLLFSLYYRSITRPDKDPFFVDCSVYDYKLSTDNAIITYLRNNGNGGELCQYYMEEDRYEEISDGVFKYYVSDDGTAIYYITIEGFYYMDIADGVTEKISDTSALLLVEYISDDFSTIYYLNDGALFKKVINEEEERINKSLCYKADVLDTGEMYFIDLVSDSSLTMMDLIEDDMAEEDSRITEPDVEGDYPYIGYFDTIEEYEAAYKEFEINMEQQRKSYEAYEKKLERDQLRQILKETKYCYGDTYGLYYFDGNKAELVADYCIDVQSTARTEAVATYISYEYDNIEKIKLSELYKAINVPVEDIDLNELDTYIDSMIKPEMVLNVAVGAEPTEIRSVNNVLSYVSDTGDTIYAIYDDSESDLLTSGDLYKIRSNGKNLDIGEFVNSNVSYSYAAQFLPNGKFLYYSTEGCEEGTDSVMLYIDDEPIDYAANTGHLHVYGEGNFVYYQGWNYEFQYGTLKKYEDGSTYEISDFARSFYMTPNGEIVCLNNDGTSDEQSKVTIYKNDECQEIASGQIALANSNTSYR